MYHSVCNHNRLLRLLFCCNAKNPIKIDIEHIRIDMEFSKSHQLLTYTHTLSPQPTFVNHWYVRALKSHKKRPKFERIKANYPVLCVLRFSVECTSRCRIIRVLWCFAVTAVEPFSLILLASIRLSPFMLFDRGTGRAGDIDTYLRDIELVDLFSERFVSVAFDLIGMAAVVVTAAIGARWRPPPPPLLPEAAVSRRARFFVGLNVKLDGCTTIVGGSRLIIHLHSIHSSVCVLSLRLLV